jgi:hypothetical protein
MTVSDEKPIESKNTDDLTKTKKPADIQLNAEELKKVSGGGTSQQTTTANKSKVEFLKITMNDVA